MQKDKFYDVLRANHTNLTTQNVMGFEKCLDYAIEHKFPLQFLKYVLATAYWESAGTMTPVKEAYWLSEDWRKHHLRYYPWYGRGLVQTTWEKNYIEIWNELGKTEPLDPDAFLTWEVAIPALFVAMEKGLYTGKDLDDSIDLIDESDDEDFREMVKARNIVNGKDRAKEIAKLGLRFERALKAGGYAY
jgi:putative chitinase